MPDFKEEIDEVFSLILDYESDNCLEFDLLVAPKLKLLFERAYNMGRDETLEQVVKTGL